MQSLNGTWQLSGRMESGKEPEIFTEGEFTVPAQVPGNIELDLKNAGIVEDPYVRRNAMQLRNYEFYEWLYTRTFDFDGEPGKAADLVFDGLDCYATVWVNGKFAGKSENALVEQRFPVGKLLVKGKNTVSVHIASAVNSFRKYPYRAETLSHVLFNAETFRVRKPAHVWGWDIAPRMAIGGIFRSVRLQDRSGFAIDEGYLRIERLYEDRANMVYTYKLESPEYTLYDLKVRISGKCGDSVWSAENFVMSAQGLVRFEIPQPKLWWPHRYGEPNLYAVTVELFRPSTGAVLAVKKFNYGIRQISMKHLNLATDSPEPDFQLFINGKPIRVLGTNHVPGDALHSQAIKRLGKILDHICDLNCNMVRVWGGGIYEDESFYDRCDREGIMIWQDFMMACSRYPEDREFQDVLRNEAETAVRRLRHHPSIIVWAGDNECDCTTFHSFPFEPNNNTLTRHVLPEVCRLQDGTRPYVPSSPWCSPESMVRAAELNDFPLYQVPEQHIWSIEHYKSDLYRKTKASFITETGYYGCPNVSSIRKFISPEALWPWQDNKEWFYHTSNAFMEFTSAGWSNRLRALAKNAKAMFVSVPDTLHDFAVSSQINHAEALKFFIELVRGNPKMTGILWWNIADLWPQFSDAVLDYYFSKKLAYHYIKRIQKDVLVQLSEVENGERRVIISNYSGKDYSGSFRVYDADSGSVFDSGSFALKGNETLRLQPKPDSDNEKLYLIEWELSDGTRGVNHLLCSDRPHDYGKYLAWLKKIAALDGSFKAEEVGE